MKENQQWNQKKKKRVRFKEKGEYLECVETHDDCEGQREERPTTELNDVEMRQKEDLGQLRCNLNSDSDDEIDLLPKLSNRARSFGKGTLTITRISV
jgi:hypothetical protein